MAGDKLSERKHSGFESYDNKIMDQDDDQKSNRAHNRREKVNSFVIILVGIFAIIFGIYQVSTNISNPFSYLNGKGSDASTTDSQDLATQALKNQDTDGDGLSDYDETNVYLTSPYLADSNGDGVSDGNSIKMGIDPNCIKGQNCLGDISTSTASSTGPVPTWQTSPSDISSGIDATTLRQVLVQGGMSQTDVDAMSDQDIIKSYQQVLAENPDIAQQLASSGLSAPVAVATSSSSTIPAPPKKIDTSSLNTASVGDLKSLTGAQIRDLMVKNGAPQALLNAISDDQLKQMFLDKLNASTTGATTTQ